MNKFLNRLKQSNRWFWINSTVAVACLMAALMSSHKWPLLDLFNAVAAVLNVLAAVSGWHKDTDRWKILRRS